MLKFELDDKEVIKEMKKIGIYNKIINCPVPNTPNPIMTYKEGNNIFFRFFEKDDDGEFIWVSWDEITAYEKISLDHFLNKFLDGIDGIIPKNFPSRN